MSVSKPALKLDLTHHIFGSSHLYVIINSIVIIVFGLVLLFLVFYYLIRPIAKQILDALDFKSLNRNKYVILELTPPSQSRKSAHATTQLFSVVYGLCAVRTRKDRLLRHKTVLSFEVVSTRRDGIRFLIRLPKDKLTVFEQQIVSYLPDSRFKVVSDYLKNIDDISQIGIMEFKQTGHFAYPLANKEILSQHDPIAYITGSMAKLEANELISFQVVVSPASQSIANKARNKLISGQVTKKRRKLWQSPFIFVYRLIQLAIAILRVVLEGIGDMVSGSSSTPSYAKSINSKPIKHLTPEEQRIVDDINAKLNQSLFHVDIRALIKLNEIRELKTRKEGLTSSLTSFNVPGYQGFNARGSFPKSIRNKYRLYKFRNRLPSMFVPLSSLLSVSEMSDIYHFPYGDTNQTENIVKSLSRTLPATVAIKHNADTSGFDVILGRNLHHGSETDIGLTAAERERHVYIIGGTGNGKTTMLLYSIVQDIKSGKGVAVVDPHGDLAKTILEHIPENRIKDVIYFDPDDIDYPISVNLLELPVDLEGSDLEREKDRITESVISVFRKIFSDDDSGGHRIEYILRNTIQTALTLEDPTIFTVFELLTNDDYRKKVTSELPAGTLKNFWKNELGKAGNMQRVKMAQGVTSKIGRFEFSIATKRVMGNPKSTIDFDDILNTKKILICNFSKGRLGEDTSALFGTAILAKLQVATNRRDTIDQEERLPFYLYVDEFQNFATMPFVQMLSEARKYKLFLTMAEQSTSQQEEQRMVNIILANVGTVVCFRTGSPLDEILVLPLFQPFIETGEIANLPSFNFYIRIAAIQPQEPLSGQTLLLNDNGSSKVADLVKANSRKNFAREYMGADKKLIKQLPRSKRQTTNPEENDQLLDA